MNAEIPKFKTDVDAVKADLEKVNLSKIHATHAGKAMNNLANALSILKKK